MFLPEKPKKKKEGVHHKNRPVNPDPEKYIVFRSKHGRILRRKRGTVKKAELNAAVSANAKDTGSKEAKEILRALSPYTEHIGGQKIAYLSTRIRRAKKDPEGINYYPLPEHEINYEFPLRHIYTGDYDIRFENGLIYIDLPTGGMLVKKHNRVVTHYYFEFILVKGDAGIAESMRTESDRSENFSCGDKSTGTCTLSLVAPAEGPYLTVLKFGCIEEGRWEARTARHYGLKIVGVS